METGIDLATNGAKLDFYLEGAATILAGGLAAQASGGNFEDGAIQAGMVHIYNNWGKPLTVDDVIAAQNANARAREKAFGPHARMPSPPNISSKEVVDGVSLAANVIITVNPYTGAISWTIKGVAIGADLVNSYYFNDNSGLYAGRVGDSVGVITNSRMGAGVSIISDMIIDNYVPISNSEYMNGFYTDNIQP